MLLILPVLIPQAQAQESSAQFPGGSVIIGPDNRSCSGSLEGALRYNDSTGCIESCNATIWICTNSGLINCTNDATSTCTLDATRANSDPQLIPNNICNGINILGVVGTRTCS